MISDYGIVMIGILLRFLEILWNFQLVLNVRMVKTTNILQFHVDFWVVFGNFRGRYPPRGKGILGILGDSLEFPVSFR